MLGTLGFVGVALHRIFLFHVTIFRKFAKSRLRVLPPLHSSSNFIY